MNPQTKDEAITLASEIAKSVGPDTPDTDVALFVPYVFIESVNAAVDGKINVGAEVRCKFGVSFVCCCNIMSVYGELDTWILGHGSCLV